MAGAWADAGRTDHRKQNMRTDSGRVSGHNSVAIRGFSVVGEYADGQLLVGRPPTIIYNKFITTTIVSHFFFGLTQNVHEYSR